MTGKVSPGEQGDLCGNSGHSARFKTRSQFPSPALSPPPVAEQLALTSLSPFL